LAPAAAASWANIDVHSKPSARVGTTSAWTIATGAIFGTVLRSYGNNRRPANPNKSAAVVGHHLTCGSAILSIDSLLRRVRQIVSREQKSFTQLNVEISEQCGQFKIIAIPSLYSSKE